jgi:tetratricopeptide (TPR) repeat protein
MPDDVLELTIAFDALPPDAPDDAPVGFSLRCPELGSPVQGEFRNPLGAAALADMRWYLEEYPRWPMDIDRERTHRVEADLEGWGRALFDALFHDRPAGRLYERFVDHDATQRRIVVEAASPQVQRLPWELLAVDTGPLFARRQKPVSLTRRVLLEYEPPVRTFALPLRVLMVVSRPEEAGFIDPRSVARGMLDALDSLVQEGRVAVEFLRPPTLAALDEALRRGERQGRPFHIVHFDGHGVYHRQSGLGQLAFEHDDASLDLVDANRLGTLLQECGVPLMVLNACQSAQGDQTNPFSSVAARLIEAGVGGVLSMSHSVLVVTAARFVKAFYQALVSGETVGRATDEARRALVQDARRLPLEREGEGAWLDLHDWFLPVLYQQQADAAPFSPDLSPVSPDLTGLGRPVRSPAILYGLPPPPLHGFVGRARELLALERAFRGHGLVVLHGWGGVGKTALAAEAARWFTRTGLFRDAAFVSFEHCHSADYALAEVGRALVEPNFNVGGAAGDAAARVAGALRARPALIVFDNFESALGRDALLGAEDLRAVLDAARAWAGVDGSRVLITSRDVTFGDAALAPGQLAAHLELGGLAAPDALLLAAEILKNHGVDREGVPRDGLERLLALLGAHPLSLELVLPQLRRYTAAQLAGEFGALLAEFRRGRGETRGESLLISLEMSLCRLGPEARARLPDLAVFQGGALDNIIVDVTGMGWETWGEVRAELVAAALASVDDEIAVGVRDRENPALSHQSHPIRFHPTLLPYLADQLPSPPGGEGPGVRGELLTRYRQAYHGLASYLYFADDRTPVQARAIAAREMPNLRRALDLALAAGDAATAADLADRICKFLDNFGRWRERDQVLAQVAGEQRSRGAGEQAGGITMAEATLLWRQGEALLGAGRAAEAERAFRELLARMEAGAAFDAGYQHCAVLTGLGRSLHAQGQPGQAAEVYRRVLAETAALEQTDNVRRHAGALHADLADALADLGRYAEARAEYGAALEIVRGLGDERSASVVLGQLGTLALAQGDLAEARRRHLEAVDAFRAMGEAQHEAIYLHQLGRVAEEARDWAEAERCYKESLALDERLGNKAGAAQTCNQLAMVAGSAGRPAEAERWYRRAIALGEEVEDTKGVALYCNNLADLLLNQGRLDEAEQYAHRAREIMETLDLSVGPWTTYAILARIAAQRGRPDEARAWRRKEQETFAAFPGAAHQVRQFQPLVAAVVRAAQGDAGARQEAEAWLQQMEATDETNQRFAASARRILAGERDLDALTDGLQRIGGLLVRQVLAGLAGGAPAETSEVSETSEVLDLDQLLDMVARAAAGDQALGAQLFPALQRMAGDRSAPPELRALVRVLVGALAGERKPDLAALPPELAERVRALLGSLGAGRSGSG